MIQPIVRVVDVYPYRIGDAGTPEFLLLKRAPGRPYAGAWRMVGGKIEDGETAWQAALRELREETSLSPDSFWTIPSVNIFYEWEDDRVNVVPAFAAAVSADPVLDDEHSSFAWLDADEACARLMWPEQQRLVRLTARLLRRPPAPEWLIDPDVRARI